MDSITSIASQVLDESEVVIGIPGPLCCATGWLAGCRCGRADRASDVANLIAPAPFRREAAVGGSLSRPLPKTAWLAAGLGWSGLSFQAVGKPANACGHRR